MALQDEAKELIEAARIQGALEMLGTLIDLNGRVVDALNDCDDIRAVSRAVRIPHAAMMLEFERYYAERCRRVTPDELDELDAMPLVKRFVWKRCAKVDGQADDGKATA